MAARTGTVDDDTINKMDRAELIQVVAQSMVDKKNEKGATSRKKSERSDEVRELELQIESRRIEMEARRIEAENEGKQMELENERKKRAHALRMA